jgi:hypothetical protein
MKQMIVYVTMCACIALVGSTQLAHATNESDYKWGYEHGKNEWFSCDVGGDCHNAVEDCHASAATPASSPPNTQVTNETACVHGFIHAHNRYCNHIEAREQPDMHISCPTTWKVQTFYFIGKTFANGTDIQQKVYWVPNNG